MSEAAAQPVPGRTLEEIAAGIEAAAVLIARRQASLERAISASAAAGLPLSDVAVALEAGRIASIEQEMARCANLLARAADVRTMRQELEARLAAAPAPDPESRRHRHRAPRQRGDDARPLFPRGVPAVIGAGLAAFRPLGEVIRHPAQHAWTAHQAVATAVTAAGIPAVLVAASVTLTAPPGRPLPAPPASVAVPAASAVAAVPVSGPRPAAGITAKPGANAVASRPLGAGPARPPASGPAAPGPQQQQDQGTQAPAAGILQVSATGLDLGVAYIGSITVTASGGPVTWAAVRDSHDITLDAAQGTLAAGQSAVIGVGITAAARLLGGSAAVRVWGGSGPAAVVTVSWDALPLVPGVLPSVLPSLLPPVPGI